MDNKEGDKYLWKQNRPNIQAWLKFQCRKFEGKQNPYDFF